ncbi:class I SAM-dependent methyltransferase [Oxynema aestuarii AP17]|jgi:SAM-dependent methyltransferase|uniref:Class I SAM-dependent methyltransferase n=2 Tax=Oxynema TaxID=1492710 RepID=A0A6H1U5J4_9CYAN|nr:class I SAM-dependent methyltransferase [Oxynema aestuarii AP17]RMH75660.1 MAG: class I SAM-dependent methyltransferase [Cyanobacteria bacterium J007]
MSDFSPSNPSHSPPNPQGSSVRDPDRLDRAVRHKFKSLTAASGELAMPCVPAMLHEQMQMLEGLLRSLGQDLKENELAGLRETIARKLAEGFQTSPHARLVIRYTTPDPTQGLTHGLKLSATIQIKSLEQKYDGWVKSRSGPLFGSHPDAKAIAVARQLSNPTHSPILDIGAGTGRNTIALAQLGYPVEAIELTPVFARHLVSEASQQQLPIRVIQGNILDPKTILPSQHYPLILVSEVISHFRSLDDVRILFSKVCDALPSGGLFLFNAFLCEPGYIPSDRVRQMAEVVWSFLLTREEFRTAIAGFPLKILSEESAYEYERQHLSPEAWPPTDWFVGWSTGRNIFPFAEKPPVELRWILCRKE